MGILKARAVTLDTREGVSERQRADEIAEVVDRLARGPASDRHPQGKVTCTPLNLEVIMGTDPVFVAGLRYNGFKNAVEWMGAPLADSDTTGIRLALGRTYQITPSVALTAEMLHFSARQRTYHPVQDYLNTLRWDGKHRLATMLATFAGAEDSLLNAEVGRRFLVSAVARAMKPGCKVDTTLILAGKQGAFKSTFFRVLAGDEWFADTAIDMRHKDAYLALKGVWLYEMAELASMRPRDAETVKAFLAAQSDHYRPPYGREMVDSPRQCVFVGTTNEVGFLSDPSGARRFWPIEVRGEIRILELRAARDQLWAEAVDAYRRGERWWLEATGDALLSESHKDFESEDPWEVRISLWVEARPPMATITIPDILTDCLEVDPGAQHKGQEMRVAGILTRLGLKRVRVMQGGERRYVWRTT